MILVMSWRGSGIDWQIHSETVRLLLVMKRFLKCLEKQSQTKAKSSRGQTKCTEDMCRTVAFGSHGSHDLEHVLYCPGAPKAVSEN